MVVKYPLKVSRQRMRCLITWLCVNTDVSGVMSKVLSGESLLLVFLPNSQAKYQLLSICCSYMMHLKHQRTDKEARAMNVQSRAAMREHAVSVINPLDVVNQITKIYVSWCFLCNYI